MYVCYNAISVFWYIRSLSWWIAKRRDLGMSLRASYGWKLAEFWPLIEMIATIAKYSLQSVKVIQCVNKKLNICLSTTMELSLGFINTGNEINALFLVVLCVPGIVRHLEQSCYQVLLMLKSRNRLNRTFNGMNLFLATALVTPQSVQPRSPIQVVTPTSLGWAIMLSHEIKVTCHYLCQNNGIQTLK